MRPRKKTTVSKHTTAKKRHTKRATSKQTRAVKSRQTTKHAAKATAAISKNNNVCGKDALLDLSQPISFFSTLDTFFESYDYDSILAQIQKKYPRLNDKSSDKELKAEMIELIQNAEFIHNLLKFYNITFQDFLKLLFTSYMSIFKGQFFKKISKIINSKRAAY